MDWDVFNKRLEELDTLSASFEEKTDIFDQIHENDPNKARELSLEAAEDVLVLNKEMIKILEDWNEWAEKHGEPVF